MFKQLFIVFLAFCTVFGKHEKYDGHGLYEIHPKDIEQAKLVNELENKMIIDIWRYASPINPGYVLVSKELREIYQNKLSTMGIEYKIVSDNIKEQVDMEDDMLARAKSRSSSSNNSSIFDYILTLEEVNDYIENIARKYPDTVQIATAGKSFEGRDIKYLKISTTNFEDRRKPIVMMQSLLHAREWVTLPATLYAIEKLVVDITERDLLEDIDWIIVPVANPDGFEYSHKIMGDRFWRKNRATGFMEGDVCMGVDLNRNYDIFWGTASSSNACVDTFHGSGPFSEPETAATRDILEEFGNRIELFLDIHSYGSIILYGYGTGELPPNGPFVHALGVSMAEEIDKVKWPSNDDYRVGNIAAVLSRASGGAIDYAMGIGIPYSYAYELPGRGFSVLGFLVDSDFIEQAGFETWQGIKTGARYVRDNFRRRRGM